MEGDIYALKTGEPFLVGGILNLLILGSTTQLVKKEKVRKGVTLFSEIKEGSPSEWLKGLGITHYWDAQ